jgi:cytochrome d ubiquinol oxidase subunit II
VVAVAGLGVTAGDAGRIFHRLTAGAGLAGLVVSLVAGVATLALVWRRQYELSRYSAAVAVAAIIAGWALAQSPLFLPGLTIEAAAAPRNTLIAVIVAVLGGAVILFPSLALLFRLDLTGRLAEGCESLGLRPTPRLVRASRHGLLVRAALAFLIGGILLLTVAEAAWAHALGVVSLFAFVAFAFPAALPPQVVPQANDTSATPRS